MNEWMNEQIASDGDGILASLTAGTPIQQVHDNPHRHLDCIVGWMADEHIRRVVGLCFLFSSSIREHLHIVT